MARSKGDNEFYVLEKAFDFELMKIKRCNKKWNDKYRLSKHHEKCKWGTFRNPVLPVKEVDGVVVWGNANVDTFDGVIFRGEG